MKSYQGMALVASPYLSDPNFMRSVVYILQHSEEGAVGLVLNRPLNISIGELLSELTTQTVQNGDPVYYGGPVDGLVLMMRSTIDVGHEGKAVFIASDHDRITKIADREQGDSHSLRIFDGYSGWGPSQLDSEMDEGSWLIWDIQPDQLFGEPNELWQTAVRHIGREVIARGVAGVDMPTDPSRN